ncbi:MAG: hypothetical protein ACKVOL_13555 [Novosphingobium sp.]
MCTFTLAAYRDNDPLPAVGGARVHSFRLADRAYDSDVLRQTLVEHFFSKLKHVRAAATHYEMRAEKLARPHQARISRNLDAPYGPVTWNTRIASGYATEEGGVGLAAISKPVQDRCIMR